MKYIFFNIQTYLDLESFKSNKKFENIDTLIQFLSIEYKSMITNDISALELKYANLIYKNILTYNNIQLLKKELTTIQLNLAFEQDNLIKDFEGCLFSNSIKYKINNNNLKSLYHKIIGLLRKVSHEIFSEPYTYLKEELLDIRDSLIKDCDNYCIHNLNNKNKKYEVFTDLQIANNLWLFFKNLNYSYYNELKENEKKQTTLIKEYVDTENITLELVHTSLVNLKKNKLTDNENIYISFYLLIYNRFKINYLRI